MMDFWDFANDPFLIKMGVVTVVVVVIGVAIKMKKPASTKSSNDKER